MWVVYLNMLLALLLAIFIVWWTMGGKLRRKPKVEPSSSAAPLPAPDDASAAQRVADAPPVAAGNARDADPPPR